MNWEIPGKLLPTYNVLCWIILKRPLLGSYVREAKVGFRKSPGKWAVDGKLYKQCHIEKFCEVTLPDED